MKLKKSFSGVWGWSGGCSDRTKKQQLHFVSVVSGVRIGNLTQLLKKRIRFVEIGLGVSCVLPVVARAGSPKTASLC